MWRRVLPIYFGMEGLFYVHYLRKRDALNDEQGSPPPHDMPTLLRQVRKACDQRNWSKQNWQDFLSNWFQGAEFSSIGRPNVHEIVCYMLHNKYPQQVTEEENDLVEQTVHQMQKRCGVENAFQENYNPALQPMRHTLDPLRTSHLPLLLYGLVYGINLCGNGVLRTMGFKPIVSGKIRGWYYEGSQQKTENGEQAEEVRPIVMIPGMGIGLAPYIPLISRLLKRVPSSTPVYLVTTPHVSLSLENYFADGCVVPSAEEVAEGLSTMLRLRGHTKACFLAQSYGTLYATWLRRAHPEMVQASVLVDPVIFLVFEPDQIGNLMYKNPKGQPLAYIFRHELYIRYMMQRHFWWNKNNVFLEELPAQTAVLLSKFDSMVPTQKVYRYLRDVRPSAIDPDNVRMYNTRHGYFLWTLPMQQDAVDFVAKWHMTPSFHSHHHHSHFSQPEGKQSSAVSVPFVNARSSQSKAQPAFMG